MHLNRGTMLKGGTYRIIKVLGQGGFGITYLAEYVKLEKRVAIKELFPKEYCTRDISNSITIGTETNRELIEKLKDRFVKEAKNIARLDHPGIVAIHDIFQENNTAYYVMDYIEGESLSQLVRRSGPLPEKQAVEYIMKVGEALSYMHNKHMTHFDVKPANIMLKSQNGQPVLIDFGLSKQFDHTGSATSSVLQAVSHGYSPLELYNPESIKTFTPSPDIYALGATLYYLMSGVTPPNATVVFNEGLTIPSMVPDKYHAIIRKAMSPAHNDRYPTVKGFLNALNILRSRDGSNVTNGIQGKTGNNGGQEVEEKNNTTRDNVIIFIGIAVAILSIIFMLVHYNNTHENSDVMNDCPATIEEIWDGNIYPADAKAFTTSPDLDFFGLHGPVKKMVVKYPGKEEWESSIGGWWLWDGTYKFDENGRWVNVKDFSYLLNVNRDGGNKIKEIIIPPYYDDKDFDVISYFWEGNRLNRVSDRFDDGTFYYKDGILSKFNYTVCPGEGHGYWNLTFTDFEFDGNDNWISCKWTGSYYDHYGTKDSSKGTIIRNIEYYQ